MDLQLFCFPGNEALGQRLLQYDSIQAGDFTVRRFPDGESYVRIQSEVAGKDVAALLTLHQPDDKILSLYYFARLAKKMGARSVILIAPYLAYMRQDREFQPGEAVTAPLFAELLSDWIDGLLTFDPHLHRIHDLSEVYTIPAMHLQAAPLLARYIRDHVAQPILIGPDEESRQWVAAIAREAGCEFVVLKKERLGDRTVRISLPDRTIRTEQTPVLADDIIATARTMIETTRHLKAQGLPPPVCLGIHAVFAGDAYRELQAAAVRAVVTTNTIPHSSNGMDVSELVAGGLGQFLVGVGSM